MQDRPATWTVERLWAEWWRIGGVCGILFVITFIVGAIVGGAPPDYTDSAEEIRDWFGKNGGRYLFGDHITGVAFVLFFLPFLSSLRGVLGLAEGGSGMWSRVAFAGGFATLILGGAASFFWGALAFGLDVRQDGLNDESIRTLMYLDHFAFTTTVLGTIPFSLATSLVILQTGVLWRWLSIPGFALFVAALITPLSILSGDVESPLGLLGFIAFIVLAAWILLLSIAMIMKRAIVVEGA
jgi:hypothetical protein